MISRCYNPKLRWYVYYGGRGITVCDEWRESFLAFYTYMGPRPIGHSIDRIDNNKGYEPGNCRWATSQSQIRNRRINGNNKSGVRGVSWDKRGNRWAAELFVDGKRVLRKYFKELDEAIAARQQAEKLYITTIS